MYSKICFSFTAFTLALLAGCASTPIPVNQQPITYKTTPAPAPKPALQKVEVAPTPTPATQVQTAEAAKAATPQTVDDIMSVVTDPKSNLTPDLPAKDDLWNRIRAGFALQDIESPLVQEHENWYASRPAYVDRMTRRSQLYLFHIVEEVQRRNMPTEVALLPMIESAFNPKAFSRSSASGIWQFIPSTGKDYGLNQNWWYDGRRHVLKATNAALDYLQRLYGMFNSWDLALAAYNCGEGTVSRAIAANQAKGLPTDYLSLKLPDESRNYVPKLLAIKHIIANPQAYGLTLNDVPNKPFFSTVKIQKHIDTALAARFADITLEEFVALNPAYTKPVITYHDNEVLLLPTTKVDIFKTNMRRYGDRQLFSWQAYQARRGEKVDRIAGQFGITPTQLRNLNNVVQDKKGRLKTAQLLLVPMKLAKPLPTPVQVASTNTTSANNSSPLVNAVPQSYVIQKGDTPFSVSRRFGVTVDALQAHNQLGTSDFKIGSNIEIPIAVEDKNSFETVALPLKIDETVEMKTTPALYASSTNADSAMSKADNRDIPRITKSSTTSKRSFYTVKRGDTLFSIAQAFQVAVKDLQKWNNLHGKSRLMPGIKMKVGPMIR